MEYQPTRDCELVVERLADRADTARAMGRTHEAEGLLLMAWAAYDEPAACLELEGAYWGKRDGGEHDGNAARVVRFPCLY
ncbi:MAG: hypothetical protein NVSMB18_02390 [Acetobacteraceae bacterium]